MEPHEPHSLFYGLAGSVRALWMKDLQDGEGKRCPEQDDPAQHQALHATPPSAWTGGPTCSTSKHDGTCSRPAHLPKVYSPKCLERLYEKWSSEGISLL